MIRTRKVVVKQRNIDAQYINFLIIIKMNFQQLDIVVIGKT